MLIEESSLLGAKSGPMPVYQEVAALLNIEPKRVEDVYPCTPPQEGFMTLSVMGSDAYVKQLVLALRPDIDLERFRATVEDVVQSTPVLRTRVVQTSGSGCVQAVISGPVDWSYADNLGCFLQQSKCGEWGFGSPLLRSTLVRDDEGTIRWFVWTIHHSIYDRWSFPAMAEEVSCRYAGRRPGQPAGQFKDFAQHVIMAQDGAENEEYWRSALSGYQAPQFPKLPPSCYMPKPDALLEQHCPALPKVEGIRRTTLFHAAWALVMNQFHETHDLVFGAVVSGRNHPVAGIAGLIGPTIATVPVRVQMDSEETAHEYLHRLQRESKARSQFDQWGVQAIAKVSDEARSACRFQTLLIAQPDEDNKTVNNEVGDWRRLQDDIGSFVYALSIQCFLNKDGIRMTAAFDSSLLDECEARAMFRRFGFMVQRLAESDRSQKLKAIQAEISPSDLGTIWGWNAVVPAPVAQCVDVLVTDVANQQPHAMAVHAWDGTLTYAQLDNLSTCFARSLVASGVRPEAMIPLCFDKSLWYVVAMLGIMKAGAAFVPIDATQAPDRARGILDDIHATILVTSVQHKVFADRLGYRSIQPEDILRRDEDVAAPKSLLTSLSKPGSAAYVIFTSGSTGKPKGVVIEHQAACTSMLAHGPKYGLCPTNRVLQFTSHLADLSLFETLITLVHKGCVCIPSDVSNLEGLVEFINETAVNAAILTPSVSRLLTPDRVPSLQTLCLAGEPVPPVEAERWRGVQGLYNAYGPTECTITCVGQPLTGENIPAQTIGRPLGCVTWVVNPANHHQLVPIGAVGELLIEGSLLARGYLHEEAKTAAAFINDPCWLVQGSSGQPGRHGRLYKTGDLVRYNTDGTLVYIGRKDTQVKIRGYRVELGEIEDHLRRLLTQESSTDHPDCSQHGSDVNILVAAGVVTPRGSQQPTLVAFISPRTSESVFSEAECAAIVRNRTARMTDKLQSVLPSHMIPTAYIPLKEFPLNATGKTDRRRLHDIASRLTRSELASLNEQTTARKRPPTTECEKTLQQVWARVLNIPDTFGIDDGFFNLGGDSISAMQVVAEARSIGLRITVHDIKSNNTIATLASALQTQDSNIVPDPTCTSQERRPFSLSPIQQYHFEARTPGLDLRDVPFFLRLTQHISAERTHDMLHAIVGRHPMLRARFTHDSTGEWVQYVSEDVTESLHFQQISSVSEFEKGTAIAKCRGSLDIEHGPSFSAVLFETNGQQSLFVTAHHLVIDYVSWRVLFRDMEDFIKLGKFTSPLSLPFQDWCSLQQDYSSRHLDPEVALEHRPSYTSLDYWGPTEADPAQLKYAKSRFLLSTDTSSAILDAYADKVHARPHEILMATLIFSFSSVFHDRTPPPVFTEGHGRAPWDDTIDVSQTVGWFTTVFPVAVNTTRADSVSQVITKTKNALDRMTAHGWKYWASRYLNANGRKAFQHDPIEINFNYLGKFHQLERDDALLERMGLPDDSEPVGKAPVQTIGIVDVLVRVKRGQVQVDFKYGTHVRHQDKIRAWIAKYRETLEGFARDG